MDLESFLLEIYKEENIHARHTETQRLEVTKFLLALVGVFVALMGALKFSLYCLPFGFLIVAMGYIGKEITAIYVQRFDDHRGRARAFRSEIDERVKPPDIASNIIGKHRIVKLGDQRVRSFWTKINGYVIVLGLVCIVCNLLAVLARAIAEPACTPIYQRFVHQLTLS